MEFQAIARQLHLPEASHAMGDFWADSAPWRAGNIATLFDPAAVAGHCRTLHCGDDVTDVMCDAAEKLLANPAAAELAGHGYWRLFVKEPGDFEALMYWPMLEDTPGPAGSLFYALILLCGTDHVIAEHRRRGIDPAVTQNTLSDLERWIRQNHAWSGTWALREYPWLSNHFAGRLYALGRLHFIPAQWKLDYHVFRHRRSGDVTVLAGDAMTFRTDGQCDGTSGVNDAQCWTARFQNDGTTIIGHAVTRNGAAVHEPVTLDAADWEPVLQEGDTVLDVHIPAAGPLRNADCRAAFVQALDFFPRHVPETGGIRGFVCSSWLLDDQLTLYLPEKANIVQFLSLFHRLPLPNSTGDQIVERVFGRGIDPLTTEPAGSLQTVVADHLRAGHHWRNAAGFILPGEVTAWQV